MKNLFLPLLFLPFLFSVYTTANAQTPRAVNYQAVARNANGEPMANKNIRVQFSVISGSPTGNADYVETHQVTTSSLGLFTVNIGQGSPIVGSMGTINWGNTAKFLKVEVDPDGGSNYITLGTSQLVSVPFAFVADSALKGGGPAKLAQLTDVDAATPQVGQTIVWNGFKWVADSVSGSDNWGSQTAVTGGGVQGAGTATNPIKLINGANVNDVLRWTGSDWVVGSAPGDSWGAQVVVADPTLEGGGTSASPLKIAPQGATLGQTLKWDGSKWTPGNDDISFGGTLTTSPRISGNGNAGSPLDLASQGASVGQVLKWNGTAWVPDNDNGNTYTAQAPLSLNGNQFRLNNGAAVNDVLSWNGSQWVSSPISGDGWGTQVALTDATLAGNGKGGSELKIAQQGATNGQVLKWNGTTWAPAADAAGATYTGVAPIAVNGTNIGLTNGTTNGQVLKWNGSAWAPGTDDAGSTYTAGNGIAINGNAISQTIWTLTGTVASRNDAVGIGTGATPGGKLEVRDNSSLTSPQIKVMENEADFSRIQFANTVSNHSWVVGGRPESANTAGRFNFYYSNGQIDVMSMTQEGIVGIGTVNPDLTTRLDVLSNQKYGIYATTDFLSNDATVIAGIYDGAGNFDAAGVYGEANPALGKGYGLYGIGGNMGVYGIGDGGTFNGTYSIIGVYGESRDNPQSSAAGTRIGVYGLAKGGQLSVGVYGTHDNTGLDNYAGYFEGRVRVVGNLVKSAGTFEIDHPLDPANKYLYHSFVESPDMMNVYNGNATTDANGEAVVSLPNYFQALNVDFRYQLTTIGQPAQAYILKEIENNQFVVKTDKPNVKVSWQVTGVRNDPYAQKNRVVPEVEKKGLEKGKYKHPEVYGQPASAGVASPIEAATSAPRATKKDAKRKEKQIVR